MDQNGRAAADEPLRSRQPEPVRGARDEDGLLVERQHPLAESIFGLQLDMELTSDGGHIVVTGEGGMIAGIPTGPLAELVTSVVAPRL